MVVAAKLDVTEAMPEDDMDVSKVAEMVSDTVVSLPEVDMLDDESALPDVGLLPVDEVLLMMEPA